jgi:uncharacterized protein YciI
MTAVERRAVLLALAALATAGSAAAQPQSGGGGGLLFAVVYRAGPNWKAGLPMEKQGLRDHFFYMRDLHARGTILLAGPRGAEGGLIILRAADQAEADRILAADPAVTAGLFVGEALPFVARFTSDGPIAPPPG